jgi:hypothetical protein
MFLCRAAYYSERAHVGRTQEEDSEILRPIYEAGCRNNPPRGLTGVLLVDGTVFVQVLEGERSLLWRTLTRIELDHRHRNFTLFGLHEVSSRQFSCWEVLIRRSYQTGSSRSWFPDLETETYAGAVAKAGRLQRSGHEHLRIRARRKITQ